MSTKPHPGTTVTWTRLRQALLEQALRHAGNMVTEAAANHGEAFSEEVRLELRKLTTAFCDVDSAIRRCPMPD